MMAVGGGPGVLALTGLLQLVHGQPIKQLAARWDRQSRWRQTFMGTLIVIAASAVIFTVIGVYLVYVWAR